EMSRGLGDVYKRQREARAACERQLAARGPSATVFYWLGLLSDVAGQEQEAQDFYRKALYLEPQHAEALAHLAALLAARGDHAGARRLQQRAARGVNKDG
ncbi:tetratricopeptide repeat protein, partial [Pseudomonas aeruginosa]|uniref:tetratricopeptide repeat protein n=1 Tax=Pseudomonas aeruginosa TaxID=287 RepID=UPI001CA492B0